MKKVQVIAAALVALFAFGALATSALAVTPEWLDEGAAIAKAVKVDVEGTVILTDLTFGISLECVGEGTGTVGPGKVDEVTTLKATACKVLKGSCASPTATPVKLPWKTELGVKGAAWIDTITSESGYNVVCGGIISDTCTSKASIAKMEILLPLEDPLHLEFIEGEKIGKCTLGGAEAGDVSGLLFLLASEAGHLISVS